MHETPQPDAPMPEPLAPDAPIPERRLTREESDRLLDDRDWLEARYLDDGLSLTRLARLLGCGRKTLSSALVRHGIPRRPPGSRPLIDPRLADADWLRAHYEEAGWSLARIAEELGCSRSTVHAALRRQGIPRRRRGPAPGSPPPRPSKTLRRDNRSGYRGVTWARRAATWQAQIQVAGTRKFLGYYDDIEDAARAYDAAAREVYGDDAPVNLPDPT